MEHLVRQQSVVDDLLKRSEPLIRGQGQLISNCSIIQMEIAGGEPALQDLARRGADHAPKRAREMSRIGEPGRVGRVRDGLAARELTGPALQAQPKDIRAEGNADRRREQVQES
jgi:hypothetical protein